MSRTEAGGEAPITNGLASFMVETKADGIPAPVLEQARRLWLDLLGVAMAGSREPIGRWIADHVREQGGDPSAVVIGHHLRTSPGLAALANGTMAHALDYDDISVTWLGHPSAMLVTALLALGTRLHASGRDVLSAYVLGWELGAAVGRSIRHRVHEAGWHSTAVIGAVATAAACGRLLGLNVERTRVALAIGGSLAAGLYANRGTDAKPLHAGNAARSGILASDLAARGFSASEHIFDGPGSLTQTLIGEDPDPAAMLGPLGKSWDLLTPGPTLKLHACCGASHYCLDALLAILAENSIAPDEVEGVECHVPPGVPEVLIYREPVTGLEGKFSLEYAMAAAILDRRAGIAQFTDEAVARPEARALLRRVRYVHPDGLEGSTREIVAQPHSVVLTLSDGRRFEAACRYFRGRGENPLERAELVRKFQDNADGVLTPAARERVIDIVDRMEELKDVGSLDAALA